MLGGGAAFLYAQSGNLIVDGELSVGSGSSPAFTVDAYGTLRAQNNSSASSIYMWAPTINSSGTTYYKALDLFAETYNIPSGVTDSGYRVGLGVQGYVSDPNFSGTLVNQYGVWARHGSNSGNGGTIYNSCGVFIDSLTSANTTIRDLYGLYQGSSNAKNYFAGNIGIGTDYVGSGGSAAILFANSGVKPTSLINEAGLYATNVNGTAELFAFDAAGNAIQISAHAQDAPDSLYDLQDGLPMIVKEVQYFLGYVRYTNKTRMARLVGMSDAGKSALSPSQTVCVITESFADHATRTGEQFTLLVWDQEQAAIKQAMDAKRQTALNTQAALTTAIAQTTQNLASATGDQQTQLQSTLAELQQQLNSLVIPDVYQIQPIPPRLQAALNNQGISN
jgi:hypothetical protein